MNYQNFLWKAIFKNFAPLCFFETLFRLFEKLFRHQKTQNLLLTFLPHWGILFFASIHYKKSKEKKMFLLHADISENGFYTIFWIFNRSVTKLEDADEIRSMVFYDCRIYIYTITIILTTITTSFRPNKIWQKGSLCTVHF